MVRSFPACCAPAASGHAAEPDDDAVSRPQTGERLDNQREAVSHHGCNKPRYVGQSRIEQDEIRRHHP